MRRTLTMWTCKQYNTLNEDGELSCKSCSAPAEAEVAEESADEKNPAKKRNIIIGAVLGVILVAAVLFLIFGVLDRPGRGSAENYSDLIAKTPDITDENVALSVDGVELDGDVWNYYFMSEAEIYATTVNKTVDEIDWNEKDEDGQPLLERIKYDAINSALKTTAIVNHAEEWGISLDEEEVGLIDVDLDYYRQVYGDDVFDELNYTDEDTYRQIYGDMILENKIRAMVNSDISKFVPDVSELSEYADNNSATIKIIEVTKGEDGKSQAEEAKAKIEEIKARIDGGEDFDAIWVEIMGVQSLQTTGVEVTKPDYITLYKGSVAPSFANIESTALSLKIGEMSGIVETDYSYGIIVRVAGYSELQNKAVADSDTGINKTLISNSELD